MKDLKSLREQWRRTNDREISQNKEIAPIEEWLKEDLYFEMLHYRNIVIEVMRK